MYRRTAIAALVLQWVLRAVPQAATPDTQPGPVILKSSSRVVQLEVLVEDASGHPVHGLRQSDFEVTDNGRPRDIRVFSGEIDAGQPAAGVYSNRLDLRSARMVTAIVVDAVRRPEGLQKNPGLFASFRPEFWFQMVRGQAMGAIRRMQPGQVIAIYAACPELRVVQDFTSDPDRLAESLKALVPPGPADAAGRKQAQTIDAFVPPMLSALREVVGRMAGASGRKSVVWISQAYGTELDVAAIRDATDSTAGAFNDADVPLYAVDARFSPTCQPSVTMPGIGPAAGPSDPAGVFPMACTQPTDVSDEWMGYLAHATGGRAFSGGKITGVESRDAANRSRWSRYEFQSDRGLVSDAIRFAVDDSRNAYEMGFYVAESELDGKVHLLKVTVPAKPKFGLRYRRSYTASANATAGVAARERSELDSAVRRDEVGMEATIDKVVGGKSEVRVTVAISKATVSRTADGVVVLEASFTQTDVSGKQLAKVDETVRVAWPETPTEMVRYSRGLKVVKGTAMVRVKVRDQATGREGSVAIPVE